jgi:hypothetical protein
MIYWLLRILYFSATREQIFSDIGIYCNIADNILSSGYFGTSRDYCYFSPGAPVAIAISKLVSRTAFASFYPYMIAFLAFIGVLLVARQISLLTRRAYLGVVYVFIMATLKPSVFWQLKLSTEGLAEALLQLSLGIALLVHRSRSIPLSFLCGSTIAWLFLTRPQYLLSVPFLLIFFWVIDCNATNARSLLSQSLQKSLAITRQPLKIFKTQRPFIAFCLGIVVLWGPWITRNYLHYHRVIPVSMAGAMTALWDYDLGPIIPNLYRSITLSDGTTVPLTLEAMTQQRNKVANDLQYYDYLVELNRRWLRLNYPYLWVPFISRSINELSANDAGGLTTVSRDYLFPWQFKGYIVPYAQQSPLNIILIDKTPPLMIGGIVGLILFCRRYPHESLPLFGLVLVMWCVPGLTMGYPRVIDAVVGPTMFGCFYFVAVYVERAYAAGSTGAPL